MSDTSILLVALEDIRCFLNENSELFFNERDFQMHLTSYLHQTGNYSDVDVEYYVPTDELDGYKKLWNSELKLDIVISNGKDYVPIELKYKTKKTGKIFPRFGEELPKKIDVVKNQGARDLGMYDFWKDVHRIELVRKRFCNVKHGLAVFVTNDVGYTKPCNGKPNHLNFAMNNGTHPKDKHWQIKDSKCCKTHPDFDVEKEYTINWNSKKIEGETIFYTVLTI